MDGRRKKHPQSELELVLMGKPALKIPKHRDIISLDFVSNELKFAVKVQTQGAGALFPV